jgi:threonine dehydratase
LQPFSGFQRLYVKDESVQPNGTFKDRLSVCAKDVVPRHATIAAISYGNTAISLCRVLAGDARELVIFIPSDLPSWHLGPSSTGRTLDGATLRREIERFAIVIELDLAAGVYDDDALATIAHRHGACGSPFVNATEGLSVPAYVPIIEEIHRQLGRLPDVCLVPFGAGILCNEIRDYVDRLESQCEVIALAVASPSSIARMLYGPIWVDVDELRLRGVAMSRHRSPDRTGALRRSYPVYAVTDDEIRVGLKRAGEAKVSCEPSGAVGLGVLDRLPVLVPSIDSEHSVVVAINTGNGIDGFFCGS